MIADTEIQALYESVKDLPHMRPTEKWGKAFAFYNANHEIKIGMACRPCYAKVLRYLQFRLGLRESEFDTERYLRS